VRRVVYLGTPAIAVPALEALVNSAVEVAAVVTGEPRRRGRRADPTPTPVAEYATKAGLRVAHDLSPLDDPTIDLGVVVAFGTILPRSVLTRVPMVNLHFSLLPRWRGAAPVERALLTGDQRTGVCVMVVEEGLDTGGVLAHEAVDIGMDDTAASLSARLALVGASLLVDTLTGDLPTAKPQTGEAVYAAKITPADLVLDWAESAEILERRVRVGGAWTTCRGKRLRVTAVRPIPSQDHLGEGEMRVDAGVVVGARDGCLELLEVIPEGRSPLEAAQWARGLRPRPGETLGVTP
jgi:methionyl-tRNA formyltransferase